MRQIKEIIVHYSKSDRPEHDDVSVIRKWHTSPDPNDLSKPWSDIGYHFFMPRSGVMQMGRPIERIGAHTKGHNKHSIGICIHGHFEIYEVQRQQLVQWIIMFMNIFNVPLDKVKGHYECGGKGDCPGLNMDRLRYRINSEINRRK